MEQGGVRMIGLASGRRRPFTAPRLGQTPRDPPGIEGATILQRKRGPPPEKVMVVSRDSVRQVRCRSAAATPPAILLSAAQLQAIKEAATMVSAESRARQVQATREATAAALKEQEERRQRHLLLEERHRKRQREEDASALEAWPPGEKKKDVLEEEDRRALQELEREEEVKELRRMVLAAKCHAIREAQILEKQHIKKLEAEEEERQTVMMEEERRRGLADEARRDRARHEVNLLAAQALTKQILQQEEVKVQHFRDKRKEAHIAVRENAKYRAEKREAEIKREMKKKKESVEARKIREAAEIRKEEQLKRNKLYDVKVVAEAVEQERLKQLRKEQESQLKKAKDDLQLLWLKDEERKLQERKRREELRQVREQEKMEREWRQKALEAARSKADRDGQVTRERRQQVEERQRTRMEAAVAQKKELLKVTDHWMITAERERAEIEKARKAKEDYESRIRDQIKYQEAVRAKEADQLKREREEEAMRIKQKEAALVRLKLDTMKELRNMALPEQLIQDLEKKLHISKIDRQTRNNKNRTK
ncbi:cilia- and flagella-associated protein 45-like [Penaeus chinensis]|uniref:cilia- and flagella-associated protein 45-like n=1 Tax=Penaeus chinensis TaxID=139456 RepID=UPI001FB6DA91|nr:cilia- and flagella-associated protein 45-like [Penaeus chinensis]